MTNYKTRFKSSKFILFIVAVGYVMLILCVGSFFVLESIIPGLILLTLGIYLAFSHTGFDIDLENRRFRHFTSHFWYKEGNWNKDRGLHEKIIHQKT